MLTGKPLAFVEEYVEKLSTGLEQKQHKPDLTHDQKAWLSFCIMCIIVTESICWRKYVRVGLGQYSEALLSYYFCCDMTWNLLIAVSIRVLQRHLQLEALIAWLNDWLEGEGMGDKITQLGKTIMPLVPLQKSAKHMSERDLGRLEPTPSLQYRAIEVQARAG